MESIERGQPMAEETNAAQGSGDNTRLQQESAREVVFAHDRETGYVVDVTGSVFELFGYDRGQAGKLGIEILTSGRPPHTTGNYLKRLREAAESGSRLFEWMARDRAGWPFPVSVSVAPANRNYGNLVLASVRETAEPLRVENRFRQLGRVLQAFRLVDRLAAQEKNRVSLADRLCKVLVNVCKYRHALIILLDQPGSPTGAGECGLGPDFTEVFAMMQNGKPAPCCVKALKQAEPVVTRLPSPDCIPCPLTPRDYGNASVITLRLAHKRSLHGLLSVAALEGHADPESDLGFIRELAGKVSLALHALEPGVTGQGRSAAPGRKSGGPGGQARTDGGTGQTPATSREKGLDQRYRSLFQSAGSGMMVVDPQGRIEEANPAAAALHGFSARHLEGLSYDALVWNGEGDAFRRHWREAWQSGEARMDAVHVTRDNERVQVEARASRLQLDGEARLLVTLTDIGGQRQQDMLRALLASQVLAAQENERLRLSRELHDEIGQLLASLNFELEILRRSAEERSDAAPIDIVSLIEAVKKGAADLRRVCRSLRPPTLDDLGIESAVRVLAGDFERNNGIRIQLDIDLHGQEARIPAATALCIYRVMQEALNNIGRHAHADEVDVSLYSLGDEVVLSVSDNGVGLGAAGAGAGGGCGITGMHERAGLASGKLEIGSEPGRGTSVLLTVPLYGS
jgi:PAS domain S-box-containing protein